MGSYKENDYKVFDIFRNHWALVTAGNIEDFNSCTVSWGSMGTLWTSNKDTGSVITVYIHPARYTNGFMRDNNTFTVSFFPEEYKKAMGYIGSHSGRDGDKAAAAGLTPISFGDSVTYKEASLTFLCKKMYQHQFDNDGLAEEIKDYYAANPKVYPSSRPEGWEPHWEFIGEIIDTLDSDNK